MKFVSSILYKTDFIFFILLFTILVGIVVVTLRSRTYAIGYEIAAIKSEEKKLRQKQIELKTQLIFIEKNAREFLLQEKKTDGKLLYSFPDRNHVIYKK